MSATQEPTSQVKQFAQNIREKLPGHGDPQRAAEAVRIDIRNLLGSIVPPHMEESLQAALHIVEAEIAPIEILIRHSLVRERATWYTGPSPLSKHWPALKDYLANVKHWDPDAIRSIDESSTEVVSLLEDPSKQQFNCRGLVVGYVQSGKTANMTAVIAKAVDAGYNLVVLLAGVTNKLRAQTQRRVEKDIVERYRNLWHFYTNPDDHGDFLMPHNRQFAMPAKGGAQIAVMKKVVSRLASFRKTVGQTPHATMRELRVLLIDDECDQASVNSAKEDYDLTKINEEIRRILSLLPAVSYVGYTATPFANVFINPFAGDSDKPDDLYPKDFITALPRPQKYFGTLEVFGGEPDDAGADADSGSGLDMIRVIPNAEISEYRPARAKDKDSFQPKVGDSLEHALLWFLATCCIRYARGHCDDHMTMLVHTSPNIIQHERMDAAIRDWIDRNSASLLSGSGDGWERFSDVFLRESSRVQLHTLDGEEISLALLRPHLEAVLNNLEHAVENGESIERLDFTAEPKIYIVVGGSVLSRGLTLEGLVVSFFLRTSQQYDTLLQMGRWFGYREGYDDLPRLWTSSDLAENFRGLAQIEEEIREDIAEYRKNRASPMDFAVKVRSLPGMAITSAAKMKHVHRSSVSFDGKHVQTIKFDHLDEHTIAQNWEAGEKLIQSATAECDSRDGLLFRGVPARIVRKFLSEYRICDEHMGLRTEMLLGYVDKTMDSHPLWNIGIVAPKTGDGCQLKFGPLGKITTNIRSKLSGIDAPYAHIKALMSKRDILIDRDKDDDASDDSWKAYKELRPDVPLLLLYPIDMHSAPKPGTKTREPLNAAGHLLGVGIVFPGTEDQAGSFFEVNLDPPATEDFEEEVEESGIGAEL